MIRASVLEFIRRRCGYRFPRLGRAAYESVFRIAPHRVRTELVRGICADLDLTDEVQRATYWQGERFEQPTLDVLQQWASDGATRFFDIGSNYGFFTFALLSRHPKLLAEAFEPNPATFQHLSAIVTENGLESARLWNIGLSDQSAALPFHRGETDSGHSTFGNHPELSATEVLEVKDFETWRSQANLPLPSPGNWIAKIDVEGFEMRVLAGLRHAFEKRAFRGIAVEINHFTLGFCGSTAEEIYGYMEALGFEALTKTSSERKQPFTGNEFFALR